MYKLIVADDETRIREGIANLFPWANLGFEIVGSFANGQQALDYIARCRVDVVLTDIKMPLLDGLALAERLAAQKHIQIVFLTGYQDFALVKRALQAGARDYLVKPIKYEELLACFEKIKQLLDAQNNVAEETHSGSYYGHIASVVQSYVNDNIQTATLEQAAVLVCLSPSHLSRVFKDTSGQSFSEYLMQARMKRAAALLRDVGRKLYEIAYLVGYDNPKNFSRAFKQYYHTTPREYREQGLPRETNV